MNMRMQKKREMFFRGKSEDYDTKLIPETFVMSNDVEYNFYYNIITKFFKDFDNLNSLSRLDEMQYYACPTRLLDVTTNPFMALDNNNVYLHMIKAKIP